MLDKFLGTNRKKHIWLLQSRHRVRGATQTKKPNKNKLTARRMFAKVERVVGATNGVIIVITSVKNSTVKIPHLISPISSHTFSVLYIKSPIFAQSFDSLQLPKYHQKSHLYQVKICIKNPLFT